VLARSLGVAPQTTEESDPAGTTLHAQQQPARLRSQAVRAGCTPTVTGGASPTSMLAAPARGGGTPATASTTTATASGAAGARLATTGLPRTLGLLSLIVLTLGALGWRRSRAG